ncbi:MAG: hypothetical protein AAF414_18055 [Pseudomonadota bacterium]
MSLRNRIRDLAVILPVGALAIFVPPYIRVFDQPMTLLGIPLLLFAIFAAWLVGIVLTMSLSRMLARELPDEDQLAEPADIGTEPDR